MSHKSVTQSLEFFRGRKNCAGEPFCCSDEFVVVVVVVVVEVAAQTCVDRDSESDHSAEVLFEDED
jgi:hypothetical protein